MDLTSIIASVSAVISTLTAFCTFIIYRKNSKPKIHLEILNATPLKVKNEIIYRNIYYYGEEQQCAIIHVELENFSSMAGTITDIFLRPAKSCLMSHAMCNYKEYPVGKYFLSAGTPKERYSKEYLNLKQPITVNAYGYLIGFLYFPVFQVSKLENKLECYLEYRIAGIDKYFSKKVILNRVDFYPCEKQTSTFSAE